MAARHLIHTLQRTTTECRNVGTARNFNQKRFVRALGLEVVSQAFPEFGHVHPNDIVETGIVLARPPEDGSADLLLVDGGGP